LLIPSMVMAAAQQVQNISGGVSGSMKAFNIVG
jgi:hypothetical protein